MNIHISEKAAEWYKKEYEVDEANIRFFVRYGGMGGQIPGFSLGVNIESPVNLHTSATVIGLTFFIESSDSWYFDGKDLHISLDEQQKEPYFDYQ